MAITIPITNMMGFKPAGPNAQAAPTPNTKGPTTTANAPINPESLIDARMINTPTPMITELYSLLIP